MDISEKHNKNSIIIRDTKDRIFEYFDIKKKELMYDLIKGWMGIQNIIYWDINKQYELNGTTKFLNIDSFIRNPINRLLYQLIHIKNIKIIFPDIDFDTKIFIFREVDTDNIYFIFGPGIECNQGELYGSQINNIVYSIISIIKTYVRDTSQKIILCGHSFGCVLSQLVALKLIKFKGKKFVKKHIWLLGSGSFRWLRPKDKELYEKIMNRRYIIFGYGNANYNNYYMSLININLLQTRIFVLRDGRDGRECSEYENKVTRNDIARILEYNMSKRISAHKWETYLRELKKYFI